MRRQLHTGIQEVDHPVTGTQHFSDGQPFQDMPANSWASGRHADPTSHVLHTEKGIEHKPYSLPERNLRAAAFAARVHSLKYYIGLIGAESII